MLMSSCGVGLIQLNRFEEALKDGEMAKALK